MDQRALKISLVCFYRRNCVEYDLGGSMVFRQLIFKSKWFCIGWLKGNKVLIDFE